MFPTNLLEDAAAHNLLGVFLPGPNLVQLLVTVHHQLIAFLHRLVFECVCSFGEQITQLSKSVFPQAHRFVEFWLNTTFKLFDLLQDLLCSSIVGNEGSDLHDGIQVKK